MPPFSEACLAGAWPTPALNTLPRITSSIYFGLTFIESRAPLITIPPSSGAWNCDNLPINDPIGVLFAATMNTYRPTAAVLNAWFIVLIIFYVLSLLT